MQVMAITSEIRVWLCANNKLQISRFPVNMRFSFLKHDYLRTVSHSWINRNVQRILLPYDFFIWTLFAFFACILLKHARAYLLRDYLLAAITLPGTASFLVDSLVTRHLEGVTKEEIL